MKKVNVVLVGTMQFPQHEIDGRLLLDEIFGGPVGAAPGRIADRLSDVGDEIETALETGSLERLAAALQGLANIRAALDAESFRELDESRAAMSRPSRVVGVDDGSRCDGGVTTLEDVR